MFLNGFKRTVYTQECTPPPLKHHCDPSRSPPDNVRQDSEGRREVYTLGAVVLGSSAPIDKQYECLPTLSMNVRRDDSTTQHTRSPPQRGGSGGVCLQGTDTLSLIYAPSLPLREL